MKLDGTDISSQFAPIGTTELSYARVSITSGIHTLTNRQGRFNAWFYGMAGAGSYAYTAAMSLRNLQYELFVDGDNHHTWGDTVSLCGLTHRFKIETEGDIYTRWYIDDVLQTSTDTALDYTFSSTGYHCVTALQRGGCTAPDFCDTLRLVVLVGQPTIGYTTVYDTIDAADLPRLYNGDVYYIPVTDSVYHLTNASGCDSTVHYNLHVRRPLCNQSTTMGRDFWVMFPYNAYDYGHDGTRKLSLIASGTTDASITINSANPSWSTTVNLTAGGFVEVEVPQYFTRIPTNTVENHGIHVTSTADISLYASNYIYQSYDIATVLPTPTLRDHYIVQDYPGSSMSVEDDASGSEIGIVATEDGTEVQVLLTASDRYHSAGETFTVTLNAGYDFQLLSNPGNTFSGTEIISTNGKPIAVFQGTRITRIPNNSVCCGDYLFEQAVPVEYWGQEFILVPEQRDVTNQIRITSVADDCRLALDDAPLATINAKQTYQIPLPPGAAKRITASKPVSICLYLSGTNGARGDPSSVIIPPVEQGVCNATIYAKNTLRTDQHYTNIVTASTHVPGMTLDGGSIASHFTQLSGTPYSYAKVPINPGTHVLENTIGTFSAFFYGTGIMESYAYTTGMAMKQLRDEWTVNSTTQNRTGDTLTICYQDTVEFAVNAATEDHAIRWYVDDILQSESSLALRYRFPAVADTHTIMAVMHGDCAPDWCDTLSIAVITRVPQSDTFAVVVDTLLWYGNVYAESGIYSRNVFPTPPDGCDSIQVLHLTVTGYPDNVFNAECTVPADSNAFEMVELFRTSRNVATMSTPMVADMDGDGLPEIVACQFFSTGNNTQKQYYSNGIRVYNGQTGAELYSFNTEPYPLSFHGICLADVDGDHTTEVFVLCTDRKIRCYSSTGTLLWTSIVLDKRYLPTVADLMADGHVQVVCGPYIFNAQNGTLLLQGTPVDSGTGYGTIINSSGFEEPCVFSLGDIDNDGKLEICAGLALYKPTLTNFTGTMGNTWTVVRQAASDANITYYDGQTVVLDFDGDGDLDICVIGVSPTHPYSVSSTRFDTYVWEGQNSNIVARSTYTLNTRYGATIPYCGDLDGNGTPEIVYALDDSHTFTTGGMMAYTYDPSVSGNMRLMHRHPPFAETSGFTVFDFNQDGRNEIVYRSMEQLFIVDGTDLSSLCTPITAYSGTHSEYPIVADINGDGYAEILVNQGDTPYGTTASDHVNSCQGRVIVYGSAISGAWSSARKVWNQWAFTGLNINEDMTVPRHPISPATRFPNGTQPYNRFLGQVPYIDRQGDMFNLAPDAVAVAANSVINGDDFNITLEVSNTGDNALNAPYGITLYKDTYHGEVLHTETITQALPQSDNQTITINLLRSTVCALATTDSLVIALNDNGTGIAQHGGQYPECDTTNNILKVAVPHNSTGDTTAVECDSFMWYGTTYTTSTVVHGGTTLLNAVGCDSTVTLDLTVNYSSDNTITVLAFANELPVTLDGTSYTDFGYYRQHLTNTVGCDSTVFVNIIPYPDNMDDIDCSIDPLANPWDAQILSSAGHIHNYYSPLVGDIDGDGTVEIVAVRYTIFSANVNNRYANTISVFRWNGTSLQTVSSFVIPNGKLISWGQGGPIAIVRYPDGEGGMQGAIIVHCLDYKLRSFSINGTLLNTSDINTSIDGTISISDFNNDGWPEVYVGNAIYDAATLTKLCAGPLDGNRGIVPRNANGYTYQTAMSYALDVTDDGSPELICGNTIYSVNIASRTDVSQNSVSHLKTITPPTGFPQDGAVAVADFNRDARMDVFVFRPSYFYAYDPFTEDILFENNIETDPIKGYPLIGDIDNDTCLEIAFITIISGTPKMVAIKYTPGIGLQTMFRQNVDEVSSAMTSMTLFDFNQDGIMEIVYRDEQKLRIMNASGKSHFTGNDTTSLYTLYSRKMKSGTAYEYPIVADVNGDGAAEVVAVGDLNLSSNVDGHLVVLGGIHPWAHARKVWNQYMYNVTNINEDLTVPQYQFNNATILTDPDGVQRQPYNNFLQQATTIDRYGRPVTAVPDIVAVSVNTAISSDDFTITLEVSNTGDNDLNAPYGITLYKDDYRGEVLHTETITQALLQSDNQTITINLLRSTVCALTTTDSLVIAFNDNGTGIAQHGNQQPECDTTNNTIKVAVPHNSSFDTTAVVCDSLVWRDSTYRFSTTYVQHLFNTESCDSTVTLNLTINHSNHRDTTAIVCDSITWRGQTYAASTDTAFRSLSNVYGCDSTITLILTVNYSDHRTPFTSAGATQSLFSINATTAVRFSRGNMQYTTVGSHATADGNTAVGTWRFAEHQYDYIGDDNSYVSETYDGWVDLFPLGSSGWYHGYPAYQPYTSISPMYVNTYMGYPAVGSSRYGDWAVYNAISNGGNLPDTWRTPDPDEFAYILLQRNASTVGGTENARFCKATVANVAGLIIFPDIYSHPTDIPVPVGINNGDAYCRINQYSREQWQSLEMAGAVFMPAAGRRSYSPVTVSSAGHTGYYWIEGSCSAGITRAIIYDSTQYTGLYPCYDWRHWIYYSGTYSYDEGYSVRPIYTGTDITIPCDTVAEACNSFTWYDSTYTLSTDSATHTFTNAAGCDSVVNLTLTINPSTSGTDVQTACDSLRWHDSLYVASTDTAYWHTLNAAGCDSVVTLNLTVNHSNTGIDVLTACDSIIWIDGITYTADNNTATYTEVNTDGCDSTVTLNLTVNYSNYRDTTAVVCDSITWRGHTYAASTDTAFRSFTNIYGCDSTITLILTVNYSDHRTPFTSAGATQSLFTISEGTAVRFSRGNLQYTTVGTHATADGSTAIGTWRFAEHQYDVIGDGNLNKSETYTGWLDLFGNGANGRYYMSNYGAYQPFATSGAYLGNAVSGYYRLSDWAVYNAISNGGNIPDTWRTPLKEEWQYLFHGRSASTVNGTPNARYAKAIVAGVNGLIIFPDSYTHPSGIPQPQGINSSVANYNVNNYTSQDWGKIEMAGAVFLPATGRRYCASSEITWKDYGWYWTSSDCSGGICYVQFHPTSISPGGYSSWSPFSGTYTYCEHYAVRPIYTGIDYTVPCDTIAEACNNFTWYDSTYTVSTDSATHTFTNAAGCDSVVNLTLTINPSTSGTDVQTACDSLRWHDSLYVASTDTAYWHTLNAAGCDSVVTLNLTVNHSNTGIDVLTACDSYTWIDGNTYTTNNNTATHTLTNAAGCDSVVTLNLTVNYSNTGIKTVTACDSYTWYGTDYTASNNTATYTETNAAGCDSVVTLNLTVNHSNTGIETVTACDSYTWRGTVYTASNNTTTYTETNVAGCDSVVTLNLTINYSNTGMETITACDSYTWHGSEYTTSNSIATFTETNTAGCDSVVALNLTINHSNTGTETVTACDTYTWQGTEYTTSNNTVNFTETNVAGCDSVVTLNLTVNYSNTGIETVTACDSYTWHGTAYTTSNNTATHTETNAAGCDSVVALNLTVNYSNTGTDVQTACDTYTWIDGNTYSANNNSATYTLTNTAGCDSVVTLNLTVNYSNTGTETVTACDSYTWYGTDYTASNNTATYTETNTAGCDSVVTLNLTVNYSNTGTETVTACDIYTWIDGNTYSANNNSATYTLTNTAGCDSVVTLNLAVNHSNTGTETVTACDSYTWYGTDYTASNNTATYTETNTAGCDSVVTLNLTINYSNTGIETVTACNSYVWHGTEYTASTDTPTHTTTNSAGCDSVTTLHLTVNHCSTTTITACDTYTWHGTDYSTSGIYIDGTDTLNLTVNYNNTGTETVTACDTYTWHGTEYTTSNSTVTFTETNVAGCDSVVTLNLTLNYSNAGTETITACDSYIWSDGNTYTANNNSATYILTNALGCDSVVTLNLTINYSNTGTETITACDSYTWIDGNTYTASNSTATYTIVNGNADGCDSAITMNLIVHYSNSGVEDTTVCNSFVWHGVEYTESTTTATYTSTNSVGCDSVTTLHLTVNPCSSTTLTVCDSYTWKGSVYTTSGVYTNGIDTLKLTVNYSTVGDTIVVACDSYTWIDGNTYTSDNNTATHTLTNATGCDSTVTLHLTINHPNHIATTETVCDTYTWNGQNSTTSGDYTYSHADANGCTQVDTLHLTINYSNTGTETITACDSYTWHGNVYTASNNTATFTETNAAGCDSVVALNLTVNYSNTGTDVQTACDTYTWIDGNTYSANNNSATYTLTNTAGCDSVVTLILTVNYSNTGTETVTACDSYTWHGTDYTASNNTATYTETNAVGCDSVVTLNLTVNHSNIAVETVTACDSYTWHGIAYTASNNTATYTETNAAGCDSTVTLDLTIDHSNSAVESITACNSYVWHGTEYTESTNTPTNTSTNAVGCDSITTLYLTINHCSTTTITTCDSFMWHGTQYTTSGQYYDGTDTLNLTINYSDSGTETVTTCNTYTWHGTEYTASNSSATYTETNAAGCDSVVTLDLTINYSNSGTESVTACDTYTWHGTEYTASNSSATYMETNAAGCDSVVTLNLTINYSDSGIETVTACDSYTWHGTEYTASNGTATYTETNAAGCDSVVTLDLTINYSDSGTETVTACDSYTWHGTEYTASNSSVTYTETNAAGCDSVVTLNLTVNYSNTGIEDTTSCNSFVWHGTEYIASTTTPTFTTLNAAGCDSVTTLHLTINHCSTTTISTCDSYSWNGTEYTSSGIYTSGTDTLDLTINYSDSGTETVTACDTYTWHGTEYTASNSSVTYTETNAAGCDSVVTLNLTVNYSNSGTETVTACDTYTWHGTEYTASNTTATYTETNAAGCDSVVTLDLTINYSDSGTETVTSCDTYTWHGTEYTASNGTATYTETNAAGCDSVVTLNLTVNYSDSGIETVTACDTYTWHGTEYTASNTTAIYTETNAAGCDSVVTLNLTVNYSDSGTESVTACDQFLWYGDTYYSSTTIIDTLSTRDGCDSILVIHLTINYSSASVMRDTMCYNDVYTWNGRVIQSDNHGETEEFRFDDILSNVYGCDSVVSVIVTKLALPHISFTVAAGCSKLGYTLTANVAAPMSPGGELRQLQWISWSSMPTDSLLAEQQGYASIWVKPHTTTRYVLTADYAPTPLCPVMFDTILSPISPLEARMRVAPGRLSYNVPEYTAHDISRSGDCQRTWFIDGIPQPESGPSLTRWVDMDNDSVVVALELYNGQCHDTAVQVVPIDKVALFAPNIFTPMEENNNHFDIVTQGVLVGELFIYNREGLLVYHAADFTQGWDGRDVRGEYCPQGGYVWKLVYRSVDWPNGNRVEVGTVLVVY